MPIKPPRGGDTTRPQYQYGVLLRLLPSDPALFFELQRAPDASGAPGTWGSIATPGPFSPAGGTFFDARPSNTIWWYRARHIGPSIDPGPWSQVPVAAASRILDMMIPVNTFMNGTAGLVGVAPLTAQARESSIEPRAVTATRAGATLIRELADRTSRTRFFNGGADDLTAFWQSNPTLKLSAVNDSDTFPSSLSYSFKIAHTGGQTEYMYQVNDANRLDGTNPTGLDTFFRVRPARRIQIDYATKVSGANVISRVFVAEYTASGGLLGVTQIGVDITATSWGEYSIEHTVSPSTFYVQIRFAAAGASSGSVWYDELYFIDLLPLNDTTQGWVNLGLKSAAFQVDWQQGAAQFVEIDGTALAITMINPEPGGEYILYLKQNSQPDTVSWPANIIWQNNTTPTLSVITSRVDRVRLQWTGSVYFGTFENWWPNIAPELLVQGIPTGQVFGSPVVDRPHVDPSGIPSAQAVGSPTIERADLLPDITAASASHIRGGDLCSDPENAIVFVAWTVVNAPDGAYHIEIDGISGTFTPSSGGAEVDTGFSQNLAGSSHHTDFGPYTVRLFLTSGHVEKDSMSTSTVTIFYTTDSCA